MRRHRAGRRAAAAWRHASPVCVVQGELGLGEGDVDRDAGPSADLEREVPADGRGGFRAGDRIPCGWVLPADQHVLIGAPERNRLRELGYLGRGQAAADDHTRSLHEPARFMRSSELGSAFSLDPRDAI